MHQLLLLRHAKSSSDDTAVPDRDRPLNARGRGSAAAMRREIRELGLTPDLILVSTAKRTMETLAALEPWDDTPLIEPADELYLASDTQLFMAIREIAETVRSVMIIGHNPGLHELAVALTDPGASAGPLVHTLNQGFPTMGLAEFSVVGPWSRLEAGSAWLRRFIAPKMLDRADAE